MSSTKCGDCVFDPFAGTGTTLSVASQLGRDAVGVEKDPVNFDQIEKRLFVVRDADSVERYRKDYRHTTELDEIWQNDPPVDALDAQHSRAQSPLLVA